MKYFVLLCDGMADMPVPELDMKTPLECAYKPNMDTLAQTGEVGMLNSYSPWAAKAEAKWAISAFWAMMPGNTLPAALLLKRRL